MLDRVFREVDISDVPQCCIIALEYFLWGIKTGELTLMLDSRGETDRCQCTWQFDKTSWKTDWHGAWHQTATGYMCHFDFNGGDDPTWTHIVPGGVGEDHLMREITVVERCTYYLDETADEYVAAD